MKCKQATVEKPQQFAIGRLGHIAYTVVGSMLCQNNNLYSENS